MWVMRRKVTAAGQPGNRKDAGAPEGRPSCGRNPDNSALGSTRSLFFLNFFPPSAPELMRCEFDRQACRCWLLLRSRVVCSLTMNAAAGKGPPS